MDVIVLRALITLAPDAIKLKHLSPSATACTLLRMITTYFRDIPDPLRPLLKEQIAFLTSEIKIPLSTTQLSLCDLIERYGTEKEESIIIILMAE